MLGRWPRMAVHIWLLFGGHHCGGSGSHPALCGQWEVVLRVARMCLLSWREGVLIWIWSYDIVVLHLATSQ